MKGIIRIVVVALVCFLAYTGYQKGMQAYERHKTDSDLVSRIDKLPEGQRRMAALAMYLGFYWSSVQLLPAMCQEQGITLAGYADAYRQRYAEDHERARAAFSALGHSERELFAVMASQAETRHAFDKAMAQIGNELGKGATVADGCRAVDKKQAEVLAYMDFPRYLPQTWDRTGLH